MSNYKSSFDDAQGDAKMLEAIQYTKDNWDADSIAASVQVAKVSIVASGSTTPQEANIPVGAEIIDAHAISKSSVGSATARVRVGDTGSNITDAMDVSTNDTLTRATSIDTTYSIVGADGIEVVTNGDSDKADVYIFYKK